MFEKILMQFPVCLKMKRSLKLDELLPSRNEKLSLKA